MSSTEHGASVQPARSLMQHFRDVRGLSASLCAPLSAEDMAVQATPFCSPTKWHLAHTTWFFETFVLARFEENFKPFDESFVVLFNSYYKQVGDQHPRPMRGVLTRPSIDRVMAYRRSVDERIEALRASDPNAIIGELIELGLHHEQQHQELLLMDVKCLLSMSPLSPAYRSRSAEVEAPVDTTSRWVRFEGGVVEVGYDGSDEFCYDNEQPRHRRFLEAFELADRLVTNQEFLAFIEDGGYERPELWLDEGWSCAKQRAWQAPMYWRREGDGWSEFTLDGLDALKGDRPVCHVSFYEADAFARWAQARLATEFEWEHACADLQVRGNFLESGCLGPRGAGPGEGLRQAYGDVWEWTRSSYEPYPGYAPPPGAIGEYNGKFMCNQLVLRGGSQRHDRRRTIAR